MKSYMFAIGSPFIAGYALALGIDGEWIIVNGNLTAPPELSICFKADGDRLTGTTLNADEVPPQRIAIKDGRISR
jgi:hypothetical protein